MLLSLHATLAAREHFNARGHPAHGAVKTAERQWRVDLSWFEPFNESLFPGENRVVAVLIARAIYRY